VAAVTLLTKARLIIPLLWELADKQKPEIKKGKILFKWAWNSFCY